MPDETVAQIRTASTATRSTGRPVGANHSTPRRRAHKSSRGCRSSSPTAAPPRGEGGDLVRDRRSPTLGDKAPRRIFSASSTRKTSRWCRPSTDPEIFIPPVVTYIAARNETENSILGQVHARPGLAWQAQQLQLSDGIDVSRGEVDPHPMPQLELTAPARKKPACGRTRTSEGEGAKLDAHSERRRPGLPPHSSVTSATASTPRDRARQSPRSVRACSRARSSRRLYRALLDAYGRVSTRRACHRGGARRGEVTRERSSIP